MESNQSQSANGSPAVGKTTDGLGSDKTNRSVVGVIDQSLVTLIDRVLDVESAVRENTGQIKMVESQVAVVREIPKKTAAVEQQLAADTERLEQCVGALNKLRERVDTFERSAVGKMTERIDGLERAMRLVAEKPAEWEAAMKGLKEELWRHAELFEKPQVKTVHHKHYLNWYGWVVYAMLLACAGLGWLWKDARRDASLKASNDILWRGAWQIPDSLLHEKLARLKIRADDSSEEFRRQVLEDEAQDEELTQKLKEENIKREEAYEKSREAAEKQDEADEAKHAADELKKQKRKH
jgi:hypothetical protein